MPFLHPLIFSKQNAGKWVASKDGKILAIDKTIKVATSAEDMAAKLGELNVEHAANR